MESPGLVLLAQALILLDQQRPADALTILYAIDHLPGDVHSTALTAIGRALIDQGQPQQAINKGLLLKRRRHSGYSRYLLRLEVPAAAAAQRESSSSSRGEQPAAKYL